MTPTFGSAEIGSSSLTTAVWGDGHPSIVLLHDGLGSISQWRTVPGLIARATGRTVLAYDRAGHGRSTPTPSGPWPANWLHREAGVLGALCSGLRLEEPILVGHSDGGSIALIHAAEGGDTSGVLLLAAHAWVEAQTTNEIAKVSTSPEPLIEALGRHHEHPAELFGAWSGVWLGDAFRTWDIRPTIGAIQVPVLVVQGEEDEFATQVHATATADAIGSNAQARLIPDLHHRIHADAPDLVVALVEEIIGLSTIDSPSPDWKP